jgi:hypothetical protein
MMKMPMKSMNPMKCAHCGQELPVGDSNYSDGEESESKGIKVELDMPADKEFTDAIKKFLTAAIAGKQKP